jgi:hypothetical protein
MLLRAGDDERSKDPTTQNKIDTDMKPLTQDNRPHPNATLFLWKKNSH